ncbi:MAG: DUF1304 domain-containing protein [Pseudomonadota bacterium]
MTYLPKIAVSAVALIHLLFLYVEMFDWQKGGQDFLTKFDPDFFRECAPLAQNMGLYNGFLAAGLIWAQFFVAPQFRSSATVFFLVCVAVAGAFGAVTADQKLFFYQCFPALIGLGLVMILPAK